MEEDSLVPHVEGGRGFFIGFGCLQSPAGIKPMPKWKAQIEFCVPLLLKFFLSREWTEERKRKPVSRSTAVTITPFSKMPIPLQIVTLLGLVLYGVLIEPILVPTQAEIDLLAQLLH